MLNHDRGENCVKKVCSDLREHATKIINYEKKEMIPLTEKEKKNITIKKFVFYLKKDLMQMIAIKNTIK